MKKLPKKWCILRNEKNFFEINNYFNSLKSTDSIYSDYRGYLYNTAINSENSHIYSKIDRFTIGQHSDFTEITFEEFEIHVLKTKPLNQTIELW